MEMYLHRNGEQVGPFTQDQILSMITNGTLSRDDIVWHEGLTQWQPMHAVFSLSHPIAPPPLPRQPPRAQLCNQPPEVIIQKKLGCISKSLLVIGLLFVGLIGLSVLAIIAGSAANKDSAAKRPQESRQTKDQPQSSKLLQDAEQGDADAQYKLSLAYYVGDGVFKDGTEATKWCRKAAEQGHVKAQFTLGMSYYFGDGVPINKTEAINWWKKAAEQGDAAAQRRLGFCYRDGNGVPMNKYAAVEWWKKAAEQGDSDGWYHLGLSYKDGVGTTKDHIEAYKWIYLVHLSWDPQTPGDWSVPDLRDLERLMTASEIEEAKKRAIQWRSAHRQ
jgi:hypothetical protein